MVKILKASAIALLAILTLAPMASANPPRVVVHRRVVLVPYYDPFFYDPFFWGPRYYPYAYAPANTGDVKLKTDMKDASVYVDGGYAGVAKKLKTFSLSPGTHNVELRDSEGHTLFQQRVEVIVRKTTTVDAGHLNG